MVTSPWKPVPLFLVIKAFAALMSLIRWGRSTRCVKHDADCMLLGAHDVSPVAVAGPRLPSHVVC